MVINVKNGKRGEAKVVGMKKKQYLCTAKMEG